MVLNLVQALDGGKYPGIGAVGANCTEHVVPRTGRAREGPPWGDCSI